MREELLDPGPGPDDAAAEVTLRPRRLSEFVGQSELKAHLGIVLEAARRRGQAPDHLLFSGPPGLGKTTLAGIIATEVEAHLQTTSGPAVERAGDLAAILTQLDEGDVLFVDEIHRLPRPVEEVLYPAMEDFQLDIVLGKGPAARSIRLDLPRFTLVGATTRTGSITGPLRDRFGLVARLDYYTPADLEAIVERAAGILDVTIDGAGCAEIARRARGTPRIANRLLRRVRDYAAVEGKGKPSLAVTKAALELEGIDAKGLDEQDRSFLRTLIETYDGGPAGIEAVGASMGEETETLVDVIEPFLLQTGFVVRTRQGRRATKQAYEHLKLKWHPPRDTNGNGPTFFDMDAQDGK